MHRKESGALWWSVIEGKYGREFNELMPYIRNHRQFSSVWRNITKPLGSHNM